MNDDRERRFGRKRGHPFRPDPDFWQAWREERRRMWEEMQQQPDQPGATPPSDRPFPPRQAARFWRQFFHDYMGTWPEEHWAFSGRRFNPWRQGDDSFNPFVANLLSKGGGLLPLYVLHLLADQPRYGNEIMELITERTNGQWAANPGAIYPLMADLEERGLVEGEWDDPTRRTVRMYAVTDSGRQELARMRAIVRPKLEEALAVLARLADDLNGDGGPDVI